jgi:hypothetical protein
MKDNQINFRTTEETLKKLQVLAKSDNRSQSNWIETKIINEFCEKFNGQSLEEVERSGIVVVES